ncbi:MAG: FUSC family protein [Sphingobium sp.]
MTAPPPHPEPVPPSAPTRAPTRGPDLPACRVDAARHLLNPSQLRESLTLAPQPWVRIALLAGVQAALTGLIALPLIHISPWSHLIGFASLGMLVALFGRFAPEARRSGIVQRCAFWQVFAVFAMSTAVWLGAPPILQILLLALGCGLFFFVSTAGGFGPPGALIFVFAASASMGTAISFHQVMERTAATAIVAALAWAVCMATESYRRNPGSASPLPSEPDRPISHRLIATARIMVGSALSAVAAHALGVAHPGWAAMGAVAVMQGAHLHITMNRALQRMAGTILGALLVGLVLLQSPSPWSVILILTILTIATEVIIGINYGLAQILVTPMALLMTYLASPRTAGIAMVPERILDTLIGAGIGVILAILFSTMDDRMHLAHHHANRVRQQARR